MTAVLAACLTVLFAAVVPAQSARIKVSTGNGHGALLKSDGTLWTWGVNTHGQLGTGGGGDSVLK